MNIKTKCKKFDAFKAVMTSIDKRLNVNIINNFLKYNPPLYVIYILLPMDFNL